MYYAVRKGHKIGIFDNWPEAQAATTGFSGPEFKKFKSKEEAEAYLENRDVWAEQVSSDNSDGYLVAFTDGSFDKDLKRYSYGVVLVKPDGLLYHVGDYLRFFEELGLFRFQLGGFEQECLHLSAIGDDRSLCGQQLVRRRKEVQLDFFIRQVRCLASAVAIEFVIALPDGLAVLAVGMPHL